MEAICNKSSHFFLRPSEKWIQLVHQSKNPSYAELYDAHQTSFPSFFEEMKDSTQASKITAPLKKICFENIIVQHYRKTMRSSVNFDKHPLKDKFVGPLRKELGRADFQQLRKEKYWITEKSDSIRVMLLNLHRSRFPRWTKKTIIGPKNSISNNEVTFSLKDNCAIETTFFYATNGEIGRQITVRLEDGDYEFNINDLTLKRYDFSQNTSGSGTGTGTESEELKPSRVYQLERKFGWSFTYLIDEQYNFYLCQDEFIFPTYESMKFQTPEITHQSVLLLDGELILNLREQKYNYIITDILTYSVSNPQKPNEIAVMSALQKNTSEKFNLITKNVLEPHYYYYKKKEPHIPLPRSMILLKKKLYELPQIEQLLSLIHKDRESGEYIFKDTNKNDGLLFIPESETLNIFGPGVSDSIFEWKWPNKRLFKFSIKLESFKEKIDNDDSKQALISINYGLSVLTPPLNRVNIEKIPIRIITANLSMLSEDEIHKLIREDKLFVAQLSFERGVWKVHHLLDDSSVPDAPRLVINNYLRLIESLTIEDIIKCAKNEQESTETEVQNAQYIIAHMIRREAAVHFRIKTKFPSNIRSSLEQSPKPYEDIILQAYHVVRGRDNWIWRKVCSAKDCIGPNGEIGEELENLLYHREQRQRQLSYARCVYLPREGKWKIVDLSGWEEECACSRVLIKLEKMVEDIESIRIKSKIETEEISK